jgi:hypothetical protein
VLQVPFLDIEMAVVQTSLLQLILILPIMDESRPRMNPMTAKAIIIGNAASTSVRSGLIRLATSVRIGLTESLIDVALAYCTRVTEPSETATRSLPFAAPTFSFTLSNIDIKDNGRMGLKYVSEAALKSDCKTE